MLSDAVSNTYLTVARALSFIYVWGEEREKLELKDLRKKAQESRSNAQRYLKAGLIGVCGMLDEKHLSMDNLMDLWQNFHSFLLLLQRYFLKFENIWALRRSSYISFSTCHSQNLVTDFDLHAQQCLGRSGPL
jgi:hypothetical protein